MIHITPSLVQNFYLENPEYVLNQGEFDILSALTRYPQLILEQNLIDVFNPNINGGITNNKIVVFPFSKWDESIFNSTLKKRYPGSVISIFDLEGNLIYTARSLAEATRYLDADSRGIRSHMNNLRGMYIDRLQQTVRFLLEGATWEDKPINNKAKLGEALILSNTPACRELTSLSKLFVYIFKYPEFNEFRVFLSFRRAF